MRQLNKKEIKSLRKATPRRTQEVYLILENIEYARNVAAIFRTADAAGVRRLYLTGISHQPPFGKDLVKVSRLAEKSREWKYVEKASSIIPRLKEEGFKIIALEQTDNGFPVQELRDKIENWDKVCFVAGSEVYGIVKETLAVCDEGMYIPMHGKNASLNVAASVAIALFSW